jgi:hypothetical protein
MSKYRFKTQEEFYRDGQWNDEYDCPVNWAESGEMNHYLGQDVPIYLYERCDVGGDFNDDGWYFQPTDYVLKEEDYTGRWIKALIDSPQCTGVRVGEVIQIISKPNSYRLDKTSSGCIGMAIHCPLNTSEWELLETGVIDIRKDSEKIEVKDDIKPSSFPYSGAILIEECDDLKEFKKYLFDSGRTCNEAVGNPKYLAWNNTSFWYPSSTGKTSYKWNQLKHFIPKVEDIGMLAVQEGCKKRFSIGCTYKENDFGSEKTLLKDEHTYSIHGNKIYAHSGGGLLYNNGKYAIAISKEVSNEQDPLYICKQEYRKGMRVISAAKAGVYSGEFIIDVDPKEFRNLSGNKDVVDYSFSKGYLYYNGEYAEILEESSNTIPWEPTTGDAMVGGTKNIINYIIEKSKKPSIEFVQSVDVNLRTKKQINKFKF